MQVKIQSEYTRGKEKTPMAQITIVVDRQSQTRHCQVLPDGTFRGRWLDLTAQILSFAAYNSAQMAFALEQSGGDKCAVYNPDEFCIWKLGDMSSDYDKQLKAEERRLYRIMARQKQALKKRLFEIEMQEAKKKKVS